MELFRIYYLPQLLIDLYQPHLCLCTDDEPAVFQSDSHDDTAVQPPVSGSFANGEFGPTGVSSRSWPAVSSAAWRPTAQQECVRWRLRSTLGTCVRKNSDR